MGSVASCLLVLVACGGGHGRRDAAADPDATARDAGSGVSDALEARTDTPASADRPDAGDAGSDSASDNASVCPEPLPDLCLGNGCVALKSDPNNCGTCNHKCSIPNAYPACNQGQCATLVCANNHADCTADPGCETQLGTADNCAACGDRACALSNTLLTCQSAYGCTRAVCAPGFANCATATPDCETSFSAGGSCLPMYRGTAAISADADGVGVAIGTDGSVFLSGNFRGTVDFDPTAGTDVHSSARPAELDGFITKINADGSYGWTKVFVGDAASMGNVSLGAPAATAGGAVVVAGVYTAAIDLDPGPGVDMHDTGSILRPEGLILKLAGDGSFLWGRTFTGAASDSYSNFGWVAADSADAVYGMGFYKSTVDFDPGAGTALRSVAQTSGAIVKLTPGGDFSWVQSIDNGPCPASMHGITVGTDGAVWAVGSAGAGAGCKYAVPPIPFGTVPIVAAYQADGVARGIWTGAPTSGDARLLPTSIAAGAGGAVYIGGEAAGVVDLDPGPGVAMRQVGPGLGGFIFKLASDASFQWGQTLPNAADIFVTGTPDGGVIGGSTSGLVARLAADGAPGWTFTTPAAAVAVRGTSFVVVGVSQGTTDFDPGAGVDKLSGQIVSLSRFGL